MGPPRRLWALSLALTVLAGAVAIWGSSRGNEEQPVVESSASRSSGASQAEAPVLTGHAEPVPAAPVSAAGKTDAAPPGPPAAEPSPPAEPSPTATRTIRVLDRSRRPIEGAIVTVAFAPPGVGERIDARTYGEGTATIPWPERRAVAARVAVQGLRDTEVLWSREDPSGLDPSLFDEIVVEDRQVLVVRTVGTDGRARPDQRILFRPAGEDADRIGSWGETSNGQGLCRLGPFAPGSVFEIRAGPRGLSGLEIANGGAWQRVVADGTVVDIVVGDAPRLRLLLRGLAEGESARISVLDASTGEPIFFSRTYIGSAEPWTAPAIAPGRRVGVFVGPLPDGRYARLRDVAPHAEPIEVELQPGFVLRGRLVATDPADVTDAMVRATGSGFEVEVSADALGAFEFPGLPDEPLTLNAYSRNGPAASLRGHSVRSAERYLEIEMLPTVRVSGRIVTSAGADPNRTAIEAMPPGHATPLEFYLWHTSAFSLDLPRGRWRLVAIGQRSDGSLVSGELDLGDVQESTNDLVLTLAPVGR